jgi:hypothetical protein
VDVAAGRADRRSPAADSGCFTVRCWLRGVVNSRAFTEVAVSSAALSSKLCLLVQTFFLKCRRHQLLILAKMNLITEKEQLPVI